MRALFTSILIMAAVAGPSLCSGQHSGHSGHASHQSGDSAFRALQARGQRVMGVDQYTSTHTFELLPDGGRIELVRDTVDSVGARSIREHLRDVARRLAAGDFSLSEVVHAKEIPGARVLSDRRTHVKYEYRELPRGGEIRILTKDAKAVAAVHDFLNFQKHEHHPPGR
jgi:hypothetical protein